MIKTWRHNYIFSENDEFLAKLNNEEYLLCQDRQINNIGNLSSQTKKELLNMTQEQFRRIKEDILPRVYKNAELNNDYTFDKSNSFYNENFELEYKKIYNINDNNFECYKFALLDEDSYKKAIEFINVEYLKQNQFSYNEIKKIIKLKPKKINYLKNILFDPNHRKKIHFKKESLLELMNLDSKNFNAVAGLSDYLKISQIEDYLKFHLRTNIQFKDNLTKKEKEFIDKINDSSLPYKTIDILTRKTVM